MPNLKTPIRVWLTASLGIILALGLVLAESHAHEPEDRRLPDADGEDAQAAAQDLLAGADEKSPAAAVGIYCPDTGTVSLRSVSSAHPAAWTVETGSSGGLPLSGDWDGDGTDSWAIFTPEQSMFELDPLSAGAAFNFSCSTSPAYPIAGDWDNDGKDSVGLYYPKERRFCLTNINREGPAVVDFTLEYALPNAHPISGHWTPAPGESVGLYDRDSGYLLLLAEPNAQSSILYSWEGGSSTWDWQPLAGDWDGDGIDTAGFLRSDGHVFCMRREHRPSYGDSCVVFSPPAAAASRCTAVSTKLYRKTPVALEQSPKGPQICTGYNPEWQIWGQAGNCNLEVRVHRCPRGYAMLGAQDGRSIGTVCGTCCPLPASDMLTDEHVYVRAQCPPEHVVTGVRGPLEYHEHAQNGYLRCTKINPRYQLGKRAENLYYGYGISAFSERARRTIRSRMPAALRWGIGRAWLELLEMDGCISYPWGSLLTGAGGKCHAMSFHRLEYRGLPGDPAAGTAVKVYPECTAISSSFSPDARCLP